jgi:hypothetical protein
VLFSEQFGIKYMGDEEWFNPILHQDTLLFIDPFSVFKSQALNLKMNYLKTATLKLCISFNRHLN